MSKKQNFHASQKKRHIFFMYENNNLETLCRYSTIDKCLVNIKIFNSKVSALNHLNTELIYV